MVVYFLSHVKKLDQNQLEAHRRSNPNKEQLCKRQQNWNHDHQETKTKAVELKKTARGLQNLNKPSKHKEISVVTGFLTTLSSNPDNKLKNPHLSNRLQQQSLSEVTPE